MSSEHLSLCGHTFQPYLSPHAIRARVKAIADRISKDYAQRPELVVLIVLRGGFVFGADLIRELGLPLHVQFVRLSSYEGTESMGVVKEEMPFIEESLVAKDVLIVEDIVDSGKTLGYLRERLRLAKARSIRIASLLFKPKAFKENYPVDYIGFEIPNAFVVGYGLDVDGRGRELPGIYQRVENETQP